MKKGVVRGKNIHEKMRIASLTKVFISFWALKKWGKDFQYKTQFFLSKDKTLYIKGAKDPYFLEHGLFYLMAELNKMGVKKLKRVVFDSSFYFHFQRDGKKILEKLRVYFNSSRWGEKVRGNPQSIGGQYKKIRSLVAERLGDRWPKKIQIEVKDISRGEAKLENQQLSWILPSAKLPYYLKILNAYSNNMTSDEITEQLGGIGAFNSFLKSNLKLSLSFHTGSGLNKGEGRNRLDNEATCFEVLQLVKKLRELLRDEGMTPLDIFPMAQEDVGTLADRFKDWAYTQSFVFKTGTLKIKPTSSLLAMSIGRDINFLLLAQGGSSYHRLKRKERQKLDEMLKKVSFKGENRPYKGKTFLMFERILKKTHFRY